ncbi:MAG: hypothetical protein IK093_08045 [Ruminiclostridium sp.]|nr:hypothetical protein [Ruminiclostridium sp.]
MSGRKHSAFFMITALLLCLALLGAFLFVAAGAHHNCTHDDNCAVCRMIDACIHSARFILPAAASVLVSVLAAAAFTLLRRAGFSYQPATLISLKTELRN